MRPSRPMSCPSVAVNSRHHLMEADAGTRLSLGAYARYRNAYQTELPGTTSSLQIPDDGVLNHGGYFDFVVDDLPRAGDSVSVVIPQRASIPDMPVYRKYDPATQQLANVLRRQRQPPRLRAGRGRLLSANDPAATTAMGVTPGDWCVRLTIKDGGVSDADGAVNGSISDPGGVGSLSAISISPARAAAAGVRSISACCCCSHRSCC